MSKAADAKTHGEVSPKMGELNATRDRFYFRRLSLENVRAFGDTQHLEFVIPAGNASRWNLILGENGVGKTTILQTLARMRPVPAFAPGVSQTEGGDAGAPVWTKPSLSLYENEDIHALTRKGTGMVVTRATAVLEGEDGKPIEIGVDCESIGGKLKSVEFRQYEHELASDGPLFVGYGAARHVGHGNVSVVSERDATAPLFSDAIDLYDAEEVLGLMHYASLTGGRIGRRDAARLKTLKTAIADLVPDMIIEDMDVRGPRVPGRPEEEVGVHVKTPSAVVPLAGLSHGYQTMIAWTVDLAWRLFKAYPDSAKPMSEAAVALIDEIDLHLHPRWQRSLRRHLLKHFPGVQFIATTHSPITAQETLAAGGNVAVVRWEGDHAAILNNPLPAREWRFDQVLISELFDFGSSRGPEAERKMNERLDLLRKPKLTHRQRERLTELDAFAEGLPTARSPAEQQFEDLMRKVATYERQPAPR